MVVSDDDPISKTVLIDFYGSLPGDASQTLGRL